MNFINEAQQAVSPSEQTATPEKLVIKNNTDERSLFSKWLRGAELAARVVFFIACGAVAIILDQFLNLLKPSVGEGVQSPSNPSVVRNSHGQPERIKVPVLPIDNYNQLDSDQVMNRLAGLSNEQLQMVRSYEARQKNRADVLDAIDRQLAAAR